MASTLMKQVPPLPGEEALYRRIAEAEMITPFLQWRYNGRPAGNGWNSPVNNAEWGTDYLNRTATGKSNSYDNRPEETKYIYTDDDSQGQQPQWSEHLHRHLRQGPSAAGQRFLVTHFVQRGALDKAIIDGSWTPPVVQRVN